MINSSNCFGQKQFPLSLLDIQLPSHILVVKLCKLIFFVPFLIIISQLIFNDCLFSLERCKCSQPIYAIYAGLKKNQYGNISTYALNTKQNCCMRLIQDNVQKKKYYGFTQSRKKTVCFHFLTQCDEIFSQVEFFFL